MSRALWYLHPGFGRTGKRIQHAANDSPSHPLAPQGCDGVLLAGDDCFRFVNTQGERVQGWNNVHTVGDNVIAALGRWAG